MDRSIVDDIDWPRMDKGTDLNRIWKPNPEESLQRLHEKAHDLSGFDPTKCKGESSDQILSKLDLLKFKLGKLIRQCQRNKKELELQREKIIEYEQRRIKAHKVLEGKKI